MEGKKRGKKIPGKKSNKDNAENRQAEWLGREKSTLYKVMLKPLKKDE